VSAPFGLTAPVRTVEVLVVWSTDPLVASGTDEVVVAVAEALPVLVVEASDTSEVSTTSDLSAWSFEFVELPITAELKFAFVAPLTLVDGEALLKLLPVDAVPTVAEESAGQPSCSSEASCAFAPTRLVLSFATVCCAASNVDAFDGLAVASALASAAFASVMAVSAASAVDRSCVIVDAGKPVGIETV
jgi:hypothetical protein